GSDRFTNRQILFAALTTLVAAGGVMAFTRTVTHSAQAAIALLLAYSALLLPSGLRPLVEAEKWAHVAAKYIPLLVIFACMSAWLTKQDRRQHQSPPWIYLSGSLFLGIGCVLSLYSIKEWTNLPEF